VSSTDERFRGKVVIVGIGGSWCPNCHDEAPFLSELYAKYKDKGLEIVELSFEEEAQKAKGYPRLLAFNKRYGVNYTVLLAGDQADVAEKVPQIHNLNSFPTTIFLGRDGLVRGVHAGFAGAVSGVFHSSAKEEITATVERLLAETNATTRSQR
jgi:thiol-disulfide isomerase/thioredoxin